jgi:2-phospho-L-lactate guanylyltransferase
VARLALAMLADVVAALRCVPALARIAVVTPDPRVARAARRAGAEPLLRPRYPDLNSALDGSAAELARDPSDASLVVLADVAGARPADLARLVACTPEGGVALAPSSDGGTSALLRAPWNAIPAAFGEGSAARHQRLAERAGVPFRRLELASLRIDVDERADLEAILTSATLGECTRRVLESLR